MLLNAPPPWPEAGNLSAKPPDKTKANCHVAERITLMAKCRKPVIRTSDNVNVAHHTTGQRTVKQTS